MATTGTGTRQIRSIDESEFPRVVAEIWRGFGWTVERELDDETFVVSRETDLGRESRVLRVIPGVASVESYHIHDALNRAGTANTDGVTTVTRGEYTLGALDVADAYGVDTVGPESLARTVTALGVEDVLDDAT